MSNFGDIMGTVVPNPWRAASSKIVDVAMPDPQLYYGVELEIENCRDGQDMVVDGMVVTTDGSLRNNGLEFITRPMHLSSLNTCLINFFNKNKLNEYNYSERTSIHVHTNCNDLTPEEVASICVLYQVFEKILFNFIGNDRANNIFCVPWSETTVSYQAVARLAEKDTDALRDWNKYTALNLLPLTRFGTIEWRHMEGHADITRIVLWCQIIGAMYAYARKKEHKKVLDLVINLNTTSQYRDVIDTVFGSLAAHLKKDGYELLIEDGVLNMKYSLAKPPKRNKLVFNTRPQNNEELINVLNEVQMRPQAAVRRGDRDVRPPPNWFIDPATPVAVNPVGDF